MAFSVFAFGAAFFGAAAAARAAQGPVTMQSQLDETRAMIPVAINGATFNCVLDTGTSSMALSRAAAMEAGLSAEHAVEEVAPDGMRYNDATARIDRLSAGGYAVHNLSALISSKLTGRKVLCGYDFFAHIPVLIDRDRQLVTLFPAIATMDRMRCLTIALGPRVPLATISINGASVENMVLDSGMVGGGALWSGVAQTLPAAQTPAAYPAAYQNGMQCGQSAAIAFVNGAIASQTPMCTSSSQPDGYNGIVETNLPTVHQIAVDYPNKRMCFTADGAAPIAASPANLDRGAWSRYDSQHPPREPAQHL